MIDISFCYIVIRSDDNDLVTYDMLKLHFYTVIVLGTCFVTYFISNLHLDTVLLSYSCEISVWEGFFYVFLEIDAFS